MKKKFIKIISFTLVCIIGAFAGYFAGGVVSGKLFTYDPLKDVDVSALYDDPSKINIKGKKPSDLTAAEVYVVASNKLLSLDNYSINISGTISADIMNFKQDALNLTTKKNGIVSQDMRSTSSVVSTACLSTVYSPNKIVVQSGRYTDENDLNTVVYDGKQEEYNSTDYANKFGIVPDGTSAIIVSSKTVIDWKFIGEENGLFTFEMYTDTVTSTPFYGKQISYNSGSSGQVKFKSIKFVFTVTSDFVLVKEVRYDEFNLNYFGINANCVSDMVSTYTYN